jgi:hypothetical protein
MTSITKKSLRSAVTTNAVQGFYGELRVRGYSDKQIASLSAALFEIAKHKSDPEAISFDDQWKQFCFPEEFETVYLAGLL